MKTTTNARFLLLIIALLGHLQATLGAVQGVPPLPLFPTPPATPTHVAATSGDWDQASTWVSFQVPGNDAVVSIPGGFTVTIRQKEMAQVRFIEIRGELKFSTLADTRLEVETIVVTPTGLLTIGSAASPLPANRKAKLILGGPNVPIDLTWDPNQMSRGVFSEGKIRLFGASKQHMVATTKDVMKGATMLDLGVAVPQGWKLGDKLVLAGTKFIRSKVVGVPHLFEDEKVTIAGIGATTVAISPALQFDHVRANANMNLHVANLTRNIVFKSSSTEIFRRGHFIMRNPDVQIENVRFLNLGRTDKTKPLDEIEDLFTDPPAKKSPANITNRRARYPVHFHKILDESFGTMQSSVTGCVVEGTPGWGFVNHGSNVDFSRNVCYDFAGAAFVTERGDELGIFDSNFAIHGTGVTNPNALTKYFFVRQVFNNLSRPQSLSDFGFGGDGFWFQGPAISVTNNVANSCSGTGMFWFTTGAVDIEANEYVGFTQTAMQAAYADPAFGGLSARDWDYENDLKVIADLPILRMNGFEGYACLVGFRLRFNNSDSVSLYNEKKPNSNPFGYYDHISGSANRVRQVLENIKVWNNEQGFRLRYSDKTDWINVENVNVNRYDDMTKVYPGAELRHSLGDQWNSMTFTDLTIDGYGLAGWIHSANDDNHLNVKFYDTHGNSAPNYVNYANEDSDIGGRCGQIANVQPGVVNQTSATISWDPSLYADTILVRYREADKAAWSFSTLPGTATSVTLVNLASGTPHEIQVLGGCGEIAGEWSSTKSFTTLP